MRVNWHLLAHEGTRELARVNLLGCLACLLRNLLGIYGRARRIRRSKQKTALPGALPALELELELELE